MIESSVLYRFLSGNRFRGRCCSLVGIGLGFRMSLFAWMLRKCRGKEKN